MRPVATPSARSGDAGGGAAAGPSRPVTRPSAPRACRGRRCPRPGRPRGPTRPIGRPCQSTRRGGTTGLAAFGPLDASGATGSPARTTPPGSATTTVQPRSVDSIRPTTLIASPGAMSGRRSAAGPSRLTGPVAVPSSRVNPPGSSSPTRPPTRTVRPASFARSARFASGAVETRSGTDEPPAVEPRAAAPGLVPAATVEGFEPLPVELAGSTCRSALPRGRIANRRSVAEGTAVGRSRSRWRDVRSGPMRPGSRRRIGRRRPPDRHRPPAPRAIDHRACGPYRSGHARRRGATRAPPSGPRTT